MVQIRIPELQLSLPPEPSLADQEAEDDAVTMVLAAGLLCSADHVGSDDETQRPCDRLLVKLDWNDGLYLVLEPQSALVE